MNDKFDNKLYEERRLCVESILNDQSKANESITVEAMITEKCPWLILIEYVAVRDKKIFKDSAKIPVELAMKISNATLSAMLVDLLTKFRSG